MDSASELVKLYADKFDLLRTGGAAPKKPSGSGASAATVKALEELKTVINGHLKVGVCHAVFGFWTAAPCVVSATYSIRDCHKWIS